MEWYGCWTFSSINFAELAAFLLTSLKCLSRSFSRMSQDAVLTANEVTKKSGVQIHAETIAQRRAEKAAKRDASRQKQDDGPPEPSKPLFAARPFLELPIEGDLPKDGLGVKLMTWNVSFLVDTLAYAEYGSSIDAGSGPGAKRIIVRTSLRCGVLRSC